LQTDRSGVENEFNSGESMDLAYLKKLIKIVSESNVQEIEIEEDGKKVRLTKGGPLPSQNNVHAAVQHEIPLAVQAPAPVVQGSQPAAPPPPPAPSSSFHEIKSPIVGTFYRSPSPDADAFVQVGSTIEPGTVLCIVEAMKLMNEIESDVSGRIAKILVENGQPIEYDQTLFLVEKS
jgi:acetyl-CoA carboxylase biotin carboxyl carrier protein